MTRKHAQRLKHRLHERWLIRHVAGIAALLGTVAVCCGGGCSRVACAALAAVIVTGVLMTGIVVLYLGVHCASDILGAR